MPPQQYDVFISDSQRAPVRTMPAHWPLLAALTAVCAVLVAVRPLNFLADDSLFYLVIADHVASGAGSTFNGLVATNGYHPLWQLLAAILALLPHSKAALLAYGVAAQCMFELAAFWVLQRALCTTFGPRVIGAPLGALLLLFVAVGNLYWSEGPLSLLCLALLIATLLEESEPRPVRLGVLLGLAFLARLDNVFVIGPLLAALWWRERDRRFLGAGALCALIGGAYIGYNIARFGHAVPISGAIKSAFYRHHYFRGLLGPNGLLSVVGAVGLIVVVVRDRTAPARYRTVALALAVGALLQSAYVVALTYGDTTWAWYYVPGYLCFVLLAAQLGQASARRRGLTWSEALFAVAALATLSISGAKFLFGTSLHAVTTDTSAWRTAWIHTVAQAVPPDDAPLLVFDQPGLFAFGTSHPVLSLDGLTSNYQFDASLGREGMYAQLARMHRAYLIAPTVASGIKLRSATLTQTGTPDGQILHFAAPLSGADAGCVWVAAGARVATLHAPSVLHAGTWGVWALTDATIRPVHCPDQDLPRRGDQYLSIS